MFFVFCVVFCCCAVVCILSRLYHAYCAHRVASYRDLLNDPRKSVVVVGAGFSGICTAIQFSARGFNVRVIEQNSDWGGTWLTNTYPGAACDIPSHLYSFSFEQNPHWSRAWVAQPEILRYIKHCVVKYQIGHLATFNTKVSKAEWLEGSKQWKVLTKHVVTGEEVTVFADFFILGTGQLSLPKLPTLPGQREFAGLIKHSTAFTTDMIQTKRIRTLTVVGTGASSIQIVPEVAKLVEKLVVVQRTPPFIVDRGDYAFPACIQSSFATIPGLQRVFRWSIYLRNELVWMALESDTGILASVVKMLANQCRNQAFVAVEHGVLKRAFTPTYKIGCKRLLISDDFYGAFKRSNVELVQGAVESFHVDGVNVRLKDSNQLSPVKTDAVLFATGFETLQFCWPVEIRGRNDISLHEQWSDAAEAYLGMTVPNFPNMFVMYGPNTNLGHNSIIFMIECQCNYILDLLHLMLSSHHQAVEVKGEVARKFDVEIQQQLKKTVWAVGGCDSWYLNKDGKIVNNWYGTTIAYWWKTCQARMSDYLMS